MPGKHIESVALKELFEQDTSGNIPILLDIEHDEIRWGENDLEQEDKHLRIINNTLPVKYDNKRYLPSYFSFEAPQEDGQKVGSASITISAIDQRIIEIIRSISSKPKATVIAAFNQVAENKIVFSKLYNYTFEMSNCTWDGISAKWNLTFDPAMQRNVPVDKANSIRCPAAYAQNS